MNDLMHLPEMLEPDDSNEVVVIDLTGDSDSGDFDDYELYDVHNRPKGGTYTSFQQELLADWDEDTEHPRNQQKKREITSNHESGRLYSS